MKITLHLTGTKPMLQNNARLANPLDVYTRRLAQLTRKQDKTDTDYMEIVEVEARGGIYETTDGLVGLPTVNVAGCLIESAKASKLGKKLKSALTYEDDTQPLRIGGVERMVDEFLRDPCDPPNIDYRSAKPNRGRVMRARPIIRDWAGTFHFDLDVSEINLDKLYPTIERAGRLVGIGNWRPIFGTFTTEVEA